MSELMIFYIILFVSIGYVMGKSGSGIFLIVPILLIWVGIYGGFWAVITGIELGFGFMLGYSSYKQKNEEYRSTLLEDLAHIKKEDIVHTKKNKKN